MSDSTLISALRGAGCVFAEQEAELLTDAATKPDDLAQLLRRRVAGEPLETILGWAEFGGLRIAVAPGVFVPRTRTGLLVRRAIAARPRLVLDMCCGSGAIAAVLARKLVNTEVHCADIDPVAVECARRNVPPDRVYVSDLFAEIPLDLRGRVDVITMSPPYVPTAHIATMPAEARDHEPRQALDGGVDGLAIIRRALNEASEWITSNGRFLFETSRAQGLAAVEIAAEFAWQAKVLIDDQIAGTVIDCRPR